MNKHLLFSILVDKEKREKKTKGYEITMKKESRISIEIVKQINTLHTSKENKI